MVPGEVLYADSPIEINQSRFEKAIVIEVTNTADRAIQVGSHYHFAEANPGLSFDRDAAYGRRLDIAAGTSVRFEPNTPQWVQLIPLAGDRIVAGLRGKVGGPL
ncbi:MAG: urease subunit beta [Actinomycetota bacterium]|nr:urease subunit beta [Actinomycetota bacterium]